MKSYYQLNKNNFLIDSLRNNRGNDHRAVDRYEDDTDPATSSS